MSDETRALIERATQAQRDRRLAAARTAWTAAIELLRRQEDRAALASALRSLGELSRKLHDNSAARAHYEESVALYRSLDDPLKLAHTVRHLGDVHHDAGEPALADPCYREALELYGSHPEAAPLDVANALRSMAVLKGEIGQHAEALRIWQIAGKYYTVAGVHEGLDDSVRQRNRLLRQHPE